MPELISDELKHKTGRGSKASDFYLHKCPGSVAGVAMIGGQSVEIRSPIDAKKMHRKIKWTSSEVPVNRYGSDGCGICGAKFDDPKVTWTQATQEQYELLSGVEE